MINMLANMRSLLPSFYGAVFYVLVYWLSNLNTKDPLRTAATIKNPDGSVESSKLFGEQSITERSPKQEDNPFVRIIVADPADWSGMEADFAMLNSKQRMDLGAFLFWHNPEMSPQQIFDLVPSGALPWVEVEHFRGTWSLDPVSAAAHPEKLALLWKESERSFSEIMLDLGRKDSSAFLRCVSSLPPEAALTALTDECSGADHISGDFPLALSIISRFPPGKRERIMQKFLSAASRDSGGLEAFELAATQLADKTVALPALELVQEEKKLLDQRDPLLGLKEYLKKKHE